MIDANFNFICDPVDYSNNPKALRVSKCVCVSVYVCVCVIHVYSYLYSWHQFVGSSFSQNLSSLWTRCSSSCVRRTTKLHSFMSTITPRWLVSGGCGQNGHLAGPVS